MTKTVQIRKKGTLTLPKEFRKRYHLGEGDPVTMVDLDEGIFLSPKASVLPKLVSEIEALREKRNISLAELIDSIQIIRSRKE